MNISSTWGLARIALAVTAVLMGLLAFASSVILAGGIGGHSPSWTLCGLAGVGASMLVYYMMRRFIRKVAGYSVTICD